MKKYEYHVGVDVSKKTLDICVLKREKKVFLLRISNDEKGFQKFENTLNEYGIATKKLVLYLENTGFYGYLFAGWAVQNNYEVWVENPIALKKSLGLTRGKNDIVDAYPIALYAMRFEDKCKLWQPPREAIKRLKNLLATRKRLIISKKRLVTPLQEGKSFCSKKEHKEVEICCEPFLQGLEKSIKIVDQKIKNIIHSDVKLSEMTQVITSVDGIGIQIATAFIVATNEFKEVNSGRALACYAGIAPFEHRSGTSVRGKVRVSHLANKSLKSVLHMGSLSAIKNSEELSAYYERKLKEGKPKMLILNAVKNKQILRIWACVRDNRMYEKNYIKKVA